MCGICVYLCPSQDLSMPEGAFDLRKALEQLKMHNTARGPDRQNAARTFISSQNSELGSDQLILECFASELQLRGDATIIQPHVRGGTMFCWNGEESRAIFDGLEVKSNENDGVKLFQELCRVKSDYEIAAVLGNIEGPYAFAFYHEESQSLYFGRDPLGRRSLLVHWPTDNQPYFILSSVSNGIDVNLFSFVELETEFIFCIRLSETGTTTTADFSQLVQRVPRTLPSFHLPYAVPASVNQTLPAEINPEINTLDDIPDHLEPSVNRLIAELDKSVRLQVQSIPQPKPGEARVGVLFSGGIDSTALCYFVDRHVPKNEPIDLLNVAFENPRKIRIQVEGNHHALPKHLKRERKKREQNGFAPQHNASYMVPDRVSGLEELEELRQVCPGRVWNFVEINVPFEETQTAKVVVEAIMFPSRTVMDLSLALALWFASRGIGTVRAETETEAKPYTSTARVLLNGLGSDELLGGYGRHRSAFHQGGWPAVIGELQLEIDRIPARNLGRDDRIISSHGKETRHPFLSLDVVAFLAQLPVHYKTDPRSTAGQGDKVLLRLAMRKLGLKLASARKKRAMQFGSHSARMEGEQRGDVDLDQSSSV